MKNYEVTLWLVVNPLRDSNLETPELSTVDFVVEAENESDSIRKAKEMDDSKLSVWDSLANFY